MRRALAPTLVAATVLCVSSAQAGGILGPVTVTVGFGSVWVGMGSGEVIRLDARNGREMGRVKGAPTEFVHGLTVAHGSVWVLRGNLTRLDPRTGRLREVRGIGSATAFTLVAGAGALWLADDGANTVTRVDPKRLRRAAVIRVPGRAFGLAAGAGGVLVVSVPGRGPVTGPAGRRFLRRIDPVDNRLSEPLVELDCDPAMAVGSSAVWSVDPCSNKLVRRDAMTLRPTGAVDVGQAYSVTLGFGSVWVVGGGRLLRIHPETLRVIATVRVWGTNAAVGRNALWVLSLGNGVRGNVTKIDPRTNRVAGRSIGLSPRP